MKLIQGSTPPCRRPPRPRRPRGYEATGLEPRLEGLLGAFWGPLAWGPPGGLLGASWGPPGGLLGPLGRVLWPLGRVLGRPGASLGAPGGLLGASWARLGASWARPGLPWGLLGRLQGAPEPENTVKTTYFHVFCRVSGGARGPPRIWGNGSGVVIFARFGPGGGTTGGGDRASIHRRNVESRTLGHISSYQGLNSTRTFENKRLRSYDSTIYIDSTKAVSAAWWPPTRGGRRIIICLGQEFHI